jgi:hypothetical protein
MKNNTKATEPFELKASVSWTDAYEVTTRP